MGNHGRIHRANDNPSAPLSSDFLLPQQSVQYTPEPMHLDRGRVVGQGALGAAARRKHGSQGMQKSSTKEYIPTVDIAQGMMQGSKVSQSTLSVQLARSGKIPLEAARRQMPVTCSGVQGGVRGGSVQPKVQCADALHQVLHASGKPTQSFSPQRCLVSDVSQYITTRVPLRISVGSMQDVAGCASRPHLRELVNSASRSGSGVGLGSDQDNMQSSDWPFGLDSQVAVSHIFPNQSTAAGQVAQAAGEAVADAAPLPAESIRSTEDSQVSAVPFTQATAAGIKHGKVSTNLVIGQLVIPQTGCRDTELELSQQVPHREASKSDPGLVRGDAVLCMQPVADGIGKQRSIAQPSQYGGYQKGSPTEQKQSSADGSTAFFSRRPSYQAQEDVLAFGLMRSQKIRGFPQSSPRSEHGSRKGSHVMSAGRSEERSECSSGARLDAGSGHYADQRLHRAASPLPKLSTPNQRGKNRSAGSAIAKTSRSGAARSPHTQRNSQIHVHEGDDPHGLLPFAMPGSEKPEAQKRGSTAGLRKPTQALPRRSSRLIQDVGHGAPSKEMATDSMQLVELYKRHPVHLGTQGSAIRRVLYIASLGVFRQPVYGLLFEYVRQPVLLEELGYLVMLEYRKQVEMELGTSWAALMLRDGWGAVSKHVCIRSHGTFCRGRNVGITIASWCGVCTLNQPLG